MTFCPTLTGHHPIRWSPQPCEVSSTGSSDTPILQVEKLRFSEVGWFSLGHVTLVRSSWHLKAEHLAPGRSPSFQLLLSPCDKDRAGCVAEMESVWYMLEGKQNLSSGELGKGDELTRCWQLQISDPRCLAPWRICVYVHILLRDTRVSWCQQSSPLRPRNHPGHHASLKSRTGAFFWQ